MTLSLWDTIHTMQPGEGRDRAIERIKWAEFEWNYRRRPDQAPPEDNEWDVWIYAGGRGAGKTRLGAEEVDNFARKHEAARLLLVGRTFQDARATMVEGESGVLALRGGYGAPRWTPATRILEWPNKSRALVAGADNPDVLRGVQSHLTWADNFADWKIKRDPEKLDIWDIMRFATRLGLTPRTLVTTTPKKTKALKRLHQEIVRDPLGYRLTQVSTARNANHLSEPFLKHVIDMYEGTELAKTELQGQWPWKL